MLGVGESHREDDQIGRKVVLTALVSDEDPVLVTMARDHSDGLDVALVIADDLDGVGRVDPLTALLIGAGDTQDERIGRPRLIGRTILRRFGVVLQLGDRCRPPDAPQCRHSRWRCLPHR